MGDRGRIRTGIGLALAMVVLGAWAASADAQTTIGVGNPGPVVPQQGLMGTYYNNTGAGGAGLGPPPVPPPGSPMGANGGLSVEFLKRIDATVNFDFQATPPPGINNTPTTADHFCVVWEGVIIATVAGDYTMATATDDGERAWFINLTANPPPINLWQQQGETQVTTVVTGITAGQRIPFRFEMYEHEGGASARLRWQPPGAAAIVTIPAANLAPPDGPNAPTLTVSVTPNRQIPQVDVSWTASTTPVAATNYILSRATAPGGPYTQVAVQAGLTFTDTNVVFGTTYYYRVQGTASTGLLVGPASPASSGHTPTIPALSVSPTSGLVTSEAGLNATITLTVNAVPVGSAAVFQITSSDASEANLSGGGQPQGNPITISIPTSATVGMTMAITVHGLDDAIADGPQNYTISIVYQSGGGAPYTGWTMPPITGQTTDNDTPGLTVTPLTGPTTENGGTATFSVTFNTQPTTVTTMTVTSTNTLEASVSTGTLTFATTGSPAPNAWNTAHVVTVTGVDDTLLDFTQPFTITLSVDAGGDPAYVSQTSGGPIVLGGVNLDNETVPTLPTVWGGGGKGGGCGLTGLEAGLLLGLAALFRRRRR